MDTCGRRNHYHATVFEKVTLVYKKSPRDSPRASVSLIVQPCNVHGLKIRYNCLHVMNPSRANIKTTV